MLSPSHGFLETGQKRTLSGPAGPGAARAQWDSAVCELNEDSTFILELWTFGESYRIPDPAKTTGELDSSGRPRASEKWLDEVRVTLIGGTASCEVPGVHLRGFDHSDANQDFVEDRSRLINGLPTWWSPNGMHFFYFAQQYGHWKLNGLRVAGGDGLQAVMLGGRKSGHGYAHSGPVNLEKGHEAEALTCGEGWFECVDGEWEPVEIATAAIEVNALDFQAKSVEVHERTIRGKDSTSEQRSVGPLAFRGWCQSEKDHGMLRLMLPQVLQTVTEGEVFVVADFIESSTPVVGEEGGYRGDPDVLVLKPTLASKL